MRELVYAFQTEHEYKKYLLGFRPNAHNATFQGGDQFTYEPKSDPPTELDWRTYGYVTPVKNQVLWIYIILSYTAITSVQVKTFPILDFVIFFHEHVYPLHPKFLG